MITSIVPNACTIPNRSRGLRWSVAHHLLLTGACVAQHGWQRFSTSTLVGVSIQCLRAVAAMAKRARTNSLADVARESNRATKFMHKAQSSNAKATLKEMVEHFTKNPSEAAPCWSAVQNGMFKQNDDKNDDAGMLSESQHHVRTYSATTLTWLNFDIYGDAAVEKLGIAEKKISRPIYMRSASCLWRPHGMRRRRL